MLQESLSSYSECVRQPDRRFECFCNSISGLLGSYIIDLNQWQMVAAVQVVNVKLWAHPWFRTGIDHNRVDSPERSASSEKMLLNTPILLQCNEMIVDHLVSNNILKSSRHISPHLTT